MLYRIFTLASTNSFGLLLANISQVIHELYVSTLIATEVFTAEPYMLSLDTTNGDTLIFMPFDDSSLAVQMPPDLGVQMTAATMGQRQPARADVLPQCPTFAQGSTAPLRPLH